MRAAYMTAVNAVEVRDDTVEPVVDPAGALLRVEACGICGTDARTFFNGDPKAPVPGNWAMNLSGYSRKWDRTPIFRQALGRAIGVSRIDPHVRDVPLVSGRVPKPLRAPSAVWL